MLCYLPVLVPVRVVCICFDTALAEPVNREWPYASKLASSATDRIGYMHAMQVGRPAGRDVYREGDGTALDDGDTYVRVVGSIHLSADMIDRRWRPGGRRRRRTKTKPCAAVVAKLPAPPPPRSRSIGRPAIRSLAVRVEQPRSRSVLANYCC
jgi:hypothetical protein